MSDVVMDQVVAIVTPFARNKEALQSVGPDSTFLQDLQVSSSRLVDIILAIEDKFGIEVDDTEADKINTIGAAVSLIKSKQTH
ncbi:MAG: acyl carrier protein [Oligoflexia bacterium]|nr:acyl carrier protein [Oligoflexia bacterium]